MLFSRDMPFGEIDTVFSVLYMMFVNLLQMKVAQPRSQTEQPLTSCPNTKVSKAGAEGVLQGFVGGERGKRDV